jgi:S1/P1 Nuclease
MMAATNVAGSFSQSQTPFVKHEGVKQILFIVFLLFSRGLSLAWSAPGHMEIAAIAYRDLSAADKTNVIEILKHHPDYQKWKETYAASLSDFDFDTFIFMRASTWPDEIRRKGNQYDHPQWHFIDYPLEPPAFPDKPSPYPNDDILYGISESEKLIRDTNSTPEVRAAYLSWLIHLLGDIHQPLHCATLVNSNYPAPAGDKGGNDFFVKPADRGVDLHGIWDQSLGRAINFRTQLNYAIQISAEHPRLSLTELTKDKTPLTWSKESRAIAIESAYLGGKLLGSTQKEDAPALPEGYTKNMKTIAERRAALAGYRLADEIHIVVAP